MVVLAAPDARAGRLALADARDVDEEPRLHVDPAGVDDVGAVPPGEVRVVGVDVEQVGLGGGALPAVDVGGALEGVLGAVHAVAEPLECVVGDLDVEVVVPGHDLAVPPPAEEGAVGQPRLGAVGVEDAEVGADEVAQDEAVLVVGDLLLEVADVVVHAGQAARGLVEVLGLGWYPPGLQVAA